MDSGERHNAGAHGTDGAHGAAGTDGPDGADVFSVDAAAGPARRHRWRPGARPAELITSQRRTPGQNRRHRERVYLALQLARIPLIGLAILTYLVWHILWLAAIVFVVSVPLPWIAVVIANEKGEKLEKRERNVYKPAVAREQRRAAVDAARAAELGPGTQPQIIDAAPPTDTETGQENNR